VLAARDRDELAATGLGHATALVDGHHAIGVARHDEQRNSQRIRGDQRRGPSDAEGRQGRERRVDERPRGQVAGDDVGGDAVAEQALAEAVLKELVVVGVDEGAEADGLGGVALT
jgi:hypothetical protein